MKYKLLLILLVFSLGLPAFSKVCCEGHLGTASCFNGKIYCGDGTKSKCDCFNEKTEHLSDGKLHDEEKPSRAKRLFRRMKFWKKN